MLGGIINPLAFKKCRLLRAMTKLLGFSHLYYILA